MKDQVKCIAYIVEPFPFVTETFVHGEILALLHDGWNVRVFSIQAEPTERYHFEAEILRTRTDYCAHRDVVSWNMLARHLEVFCASPERYLSLLWYLLKHNWSSFHSLVRVLYSFVKAIYFVPRIHELGIRHVHAHFSSRRTEVAMCLRWLAGVTFSFTGHSSDIYFGTPMLCYKIEQASFVVAASEFIRQRMRNKCSNIDLSKVYLIHSGVDAQKFSPNPLREKSEPPLILSIGTLISCKGHAYLIEACRVLAERGVSFQCAIIGDGELRSKLENLVRVYGLGHRVQLLGCVDDNVLLDLMAQSSIFALPCIVADNGLHDGLPTVLEEAMASALPTVSTPVGAIPELIEHGVDGMLVPQRDAMALAKVIRELLDDARLRNRLGEAGRRKVQAEFERESNARQLGRLIEQVISRGEL